MSKIAIPIGGTTTNIPGAECFNCLAKIEQATGAQGHHPSPGDVTVCTNCGAISKFGPNMELLPFTDADFETIPKTAQDNLLMLSTRFRQASQRMFEGKAKIAVIGISNEELGEHECQRKQL